MALGRLVGGKLVYEPVTACIRLLGTIDGNAAATGTAAAASDTQTCARPGHYPGKKASDNKKEAWIAEVRAWGDCVKSYVADLRAQVDAKIKLANSTIEEYNTGVKDLQEEQKVAEMQGQVGK